MNPTLSAILLILAVVALLHLLIWLAENDIIWPLFVLLGVAIWIAVQ